MWPFNQKKKEPEYFKAGDIVKCIDDREWNNISQTLNISYGKNYKILMVVKCPTCGYVSYDIGSRFKNKKYYTTCSPSDHNLPAQGVHLAAHFRFEKSIATEEELELELAELLKAEKYEEAAKVRDKIAEF